MRPTFSAAEPSGILGREAARAAAKSESFLKREVQQMRGLCVHRMFWFGMIGLVDLWGIFLLQPAAAAQPVPLFDGKTLTGWEGDTTNTWRVVDGAIVAGDTARMQPRNEFLATQKRYRDFDLRLKVKLTGTEGFVNAGIQFRTERLPSDHEVIGYQADFGAGFDGALYDESRRKTILAKPTPEVLKQVSLPGEWNDYQIRAEGRRIRLWLNGIQTVDYTEPDDSIPQEGVVALQIHGNAKSEVRYKDIVIEAL